MPADKPSKRQKLTETIATLAALQFAPKQRNETAAYTLLAMLDLRADIPWAEAQAPLRGITPIIDFVAEAYGVRYAPNTRETIRDDAVKFFVEAGLLLRNPDDPNRPTNSGKTVYQIEPSALAMLRKVGTSRWASALKTYLASREAVRDEIARKRTLARVPVTLPDGSQVALSPGGQNPLIKAIIEHFCPAFAPGSIVIYIGDTENKFVHMEADHLASLGVILDPAAKIPDVIVHYVAKNGCCLLRLLRVPGLWTGSAARNSKDCSQDARPVWFLSPPLRLAAPCNRLYHTSHGNPKCGSQKILTT